LPHTVTLIPGDGIGPEVIEATRRVIEATGVRLDWDVQQMGAVAFESGGRAIPDETLNSVRSNGVALKGPTQTPVEDGSVNVNVALRQVLDLFANVRPCKLYPGVSSVYQDVDLVIIRENTEDMYTGLEFEMGSGGARELIGYIRGSTGSRIRDDSGISIKAISEHGSRRIVSFAFDWASTHSRKSVTAGHKANIMKFSDGLFLEVARQEARSRPAVVFEERIIDALCMQLVLAPERFDVIVLPNLYGDIAAELGAGLIGGVGVAPGGLFGGRDGLEIAVFEATHGTAPSLAGRGIADPMGAILSGAMLLRHIGETEAGDRVEAAAASVLAAGRTVPGDLLDRRDKRSGAPTEAVTQAVISAL
jgi:isocitrate dehydrogenase (NAD+)